MKLVLIAAVLSLTGCSNTPQQQFQAVGTVRNVWMLNWRWNVTFEHDTHETSVITFVNQPPIWTGEHVRLTYKHDRDFNGQDDLISAERLN